MFLSKWKERQIFNEKKIKNLQYIYTYTPHIYILQFYGYIYTKKNWRKKDRRQHVPKISKRGKHIPKVTDNSTKRIEEVQKIECFGTFSICSVLPQIVQYYSSAHARCIRYILSPWEKINKKKIKKWCHFNRFSSFCIIFPKTKNEKRRRWRKTNQFCWLIRKYFLCVFFLSLSLVKN